MFLFKNLHRVCYCCLLCLIGCDADEQALLLEPSVEELSIEAYERPSANRLQVAGARFFADIPYDVYPRTQLDIFLPDSLEPTGLVLFAHEGGFVEGDKSIVYEQSHFVEQVERLLSRNVAFATVNYRLVETKGEGEDEVSARTPYDGVMTSIRDIQRSLQFLRLFAAEFNIDPNRVALYGVSAGAGASLWIGLQDDMKEPGSDDVIARQSTRVSAIAAIETQATYDLVRWLTDVFAPFNLTVRDVIDIVSQTREGFENDPTASEQNSQYWTEVVLALLGISTILDLELAKLEDQRDQLDMLNFVSADDPELWIESKNETSEAPQDILAILHHPYHAFTLKQRADAVGLSNQVYLPQLGVYSQQDQDAIEFLLGQVADK